MRSTAVFSGRGGTWPGRGGGVGWERSGQPGPVPTECQGWRGQRPGHGTRALLLPCRLPGPSPRTRQQNPHPPSTFIPRARFLAREGGKELTTAQSLPPLSTPIVRRGRGPRTRGGEVPGGKKCPRGGCSGSRVPRPCEAGVPEPCWCPRAYKSSPEGKEGRFLPLGPGPREAQERFLGGVDRLFV